MTRENVKIDILVEDPNVGEDGKQFHKQHAITEEELDHIQLDQRGYMEAVIRHMGTDIATKWSEVRQEHR